MALLDISTGAGQAVQLNGLNWFGFNTGYSMLDGLWGGSQYRTMVNDFSTISHRIRMLGFNFVRVPFTFSDLSANSGDSNFKTDFYFDCMVIQNHVLLHQML